MEPRPEQPPRRLFASPGENSTLAPNQAPSDEGQEWGEDETPRLKELGVGEGFGPGRPVQEVVDYVMAQQG